MKTMDIARYRLNDQQSATRAFARPEEVVAWLGAMQAQDYAGALWSVGLRLPQATEAVIEQAIAERAIVRTWPMRGTLHFMAAPDVRWMLELLTPRVIAASAQRGYQLGVDDVTMAHARELIAGALVGGKQLTRGALYQVLEAGGISTAQQRGLHIVRQVALEGLLCLGTRVGKQPTFVLLDEWVPAARTQERDESLTELAQRYFTGHGPATVQDFMWWSGLTARDARAGVAMTASALVCEVIGGQAYWLSRDTPAPPTAASGVCLLPGFDEYLLGYRDRSAALDPVHASRIVPGNNGVFSPTVVVDGRVVGTWKALPAGKAMTIAYDAFRPITEAEQHAIAAAAERYAGFVGKRIAEV